MNKKKAKVNSRQLSKGPKEEAPKQSLSGDGIQELLRLYVPGNIKWGLDGKVVPHGLEKGKAIGEDIAGHSVPLDQTAVREAFGTDSRHAILRLILLLGEGINSGKNHIDLATAIGILRTMGPQNVIEGMLMAQLLMLHEQTARLMRSSRQPDLPFDLVLRCVNTANSCIGAFKEGMEALNRFRSGGKQQVIVSHVNIEQGAQAAFTVGGDVKGGGGGVGG